MGAEFSGIREVTIDNAGRFKLPAVFRNVFDENAFNTEIVLVAKKTDGFTYLLICPERVWKQVLSGISNNSDLSASGIEKIKRTLNRNSEVVHLDGQRRIVVSKRLMDMADISAGEEVSLVGTGHYIEIWNKESLDKVIEKSDIDDEQLSDAFNVSF